MSASPSSLPRLPLTPPAVERAQPVVERGKPVASVGYLRSAPNRKAVPRSATLLTMPGEPEDARLTGGTRSLERRLLALNLMKPELSA